VEGLELRLSRHRGARASGGLWRHLALPHGRVGLRAAGRRAAAGDPEESSRVKDNLRSTVKLDMLGGALAVNGPKTYIESAAPQTEPTQFAAVENSQNGDIDLESDQNRQRVSAGGRKLTVDVPRAAMEALIRLAVGKFLASCKR
jgi:hypothetical protein